MRRTIGLAVVAAMAISLIGAVPALAGTAKMTTLNVVHGIPGLDVDVCVNGEKAITDFNPGEVVSGIALPAGRYDLAVVLKGDPCSKVVLDAMNVGLWMDRNYTAIANLDPAGAPHLTVFGANVSKTDDGQARLLLRHTAAAPAVNVWADGSKLVGGEWFDWGTRVRRDVPEGTYTVKVTLPHRSAAVIGPATLTLNEGTVYQVFAWGSGSAGYAFAIVPTVVGTA
jgi:hypothetical protein